MGVTSGGGKDGGEEAKGVGERGVSLNGGDGSGSRKGETAGAPVNVGELTDVGEPGTGISKAHRKPFTDSRTFWLSWGKF